MNIMTFNGVPLFPCILPTAKPLFAPSNFFELHLLIHAVAPAAGARLCSAVLFAVREHLPLFPHRTTIHLNLLWPSVASQGR